MFIFIRSYRPVDLSKWFVLFISVSAYAGSDTGLALQEAEQLAVANEPGIIAAEARAQSMAEKSIAAGSLPDPEVRLGIVNVPTGSYDLNQEPMTQKLIGVRQMLPPAGSRKAQRQQMRYQGEALEYAAAARRRQVLRDVREAWLEAYYWQQARSIIAENRALFSQLVKVTRSLYTVGRQNQQDMVRAELELSRLDDRLLDIDEQIRRSRAVLAQWIGEDTAILPLAGDLPAWQGFQTIQPLKTALLQHPLLSASKAQIASADAGVELARSKYKPMLGFDLSYGQRDDDRMGNPRDDFVSAMVMLSVPLFTGNRQDKDLSAARHNHDASVNDRSVLQRDLMRQLEAAFARWQQLQYRIGLYDKTIIGQSRIQAQATLQAYQNDTGDFADVMRATISDLNTRLDFIRLQTDRAKIYAQLDYLAGQPPEEDNHD